LDNFSSEDIKDQDSVVENEKDINSANELEENEIELKDNKILFKNAFYALLTLPLLFFLYLKFLDIYTLHNKYILVPDYSNFHISQLDSISNENNIRYIIIDSVSDLEKPKGIVLNQMPKANTKVKKKRRIYLTITETNTSVVKFPDVYDLTLRQALRQIELTGLLVGKLEYKSDIATNKILDFNVNGISIFEGQEILKGTTVNLVVGKGLSEEYVFVPDLIGLSRVEAHIVLKTSSLNIGSEFYDENCEDSTLAVVYKQTPTFENDNELKLGSTIDLFLKKPQSTEK
jgi:beta-lactam-binding protein with PASTA domain